MNRRFCLTMLLACWAVIFQAGSLGATSYRYQDLTPQGIPTGVTYTVQAINDAKQIVGYYSQSPSVTAGAFLWNPVKGDPMKGYIPLQSLGGAKSYAYAINKQGQIVGKADNGGGYTHACLWSDPTKAPTDLGSQGDPTPSCAYAINDNGLMVGFYGSFLSSNHAYKWTAPMQWVDLQTLGGATSCAYGVNNAGQIVGIADAPQYFAACIWNPGQSAQVLSTSLPNYCQAQAINSQGNVIGSGPTFTPGAYPGGFYWDHSTDAVQIFGDPGAVPGPLPGYCYLYGLSNTNQVIGTFFVGPPNVFSWTPAGGIQDLNKMVLNLPQGVTIKGLSAMSPQGYIVGTDSRGHACLLSPIAASPAVDLLLLDHQQ